jgi:hypothetical protein
MLKKIYEHRVLSVLCILYLTVLTVFMLPQPKHFSSIAYMSQMSVWTCPGWNIIGFLLLGIMSGLLIFRTKNYYFLYGLVLYVFGVEIAKEWTHPTAYWIIAYSFSKYTVFQDFIGLVLGLTFTLFLPLYWNYDNESLSNNNL